MHAQRLSFFTAGNCKICLTVINTEQHCYSLRRSIKYTVTHSLEHIAVYAIEPALDYSYAFYDL